MLADLNHSFKRPAPRKAKMCGRDGFFRIKVSDGAPVFLDNRKFYPNMVYSLKKREQWLLPERVSECLRDPHGPFAKEQVEVAEGFPYGKDSSRTFYLAQKSRGGGLREFRKRRGFLNRSSLSLSVDTEKEETRMVTFDFLRPIISMQCCKTGPSCKLSSTQARLVDDPVGQLADKLEIEREAKRQVALDRLEDQAAPVTAVSPKERQLFDFVVTKEAGQRRERRRRRCSSKSEFPPSPKDRKVIETATEEQEEESPAAAWMELQLENTGSQDPVDLQSVRVLLPTAQVARPALKAAYGSRHLEGCSEPRKFAINISDLLSRLTEAKAQALLIIEIAKLGPSWTTCDVLLNADVIGPQCLQPPLDLEGASIGLQALVDRCAAHAACSLGAHLLQRSAPIAFRYLRRQPAQPGTVATATGEWEVVDEAPEEEEEGFEVVDPTCLACTAPLALHGEASALSEAAAGHGRAGCCLTPCGHHFCAACWRWHLPAQIALGRAALRCPEPQCSEAVDPVTALRYISLPLFAEHAALWHAPRSSNQGDPRLQLCPQSDCSRVVRLSRAPSPGTPLNVECGGRHAFCFSCREEAHWPTPCAGYKMYKEKLQQQGAFGDEEAAASGPPPTWRSKHFGATVRWRQLRRKRSQLALQNARLSELLGSPGECSRVHRTYAELLRIVEFAHVATLCLHHNQQASTGRDLRNGAHALVGIVTAIRDCVNHNGHASLAERSQKLHALFAQARGVLAKIQHLPGLQNPSNLRKSL